ncbi:hypothetical protein GPJ56_002309 [Histomonas meleagridis]|uniref:uncharacterized protein n=1 Tax=Histomonas meleagridis TaxID=135588 RepID=UPI003559BEDB|nr:hypothetical protein GPJ56_002309 [Histomonas meleagridis]KAH0804570.1 hypothetical protein GO595_003400 [Histomonas meleagridis]
MEKEKIVLLRFKSQTGRIHYVEAYETECIRDMKNIIVSKYQNSSIDSMTVRKENGEIVPDATNVCQAADLENNEFLYFFFSSLGDSKSSENITTQPSQEKVVKAEPAARKEDQQEKPKAAKTLKDFPASERPKITRLKNETKVPIEVVIEFYEKNDKNVKKTKEAIAEYKKAQGKK